MKTESDFTRWLCGELEKCNCKVSVLAASAMQTNGLPDRHVMSKRLPHGQVWLEMKKEGNWLREDQKAWCEKAEEHGVHYFIAVWYPRQQEIQLKDVTRKVWAIIDLRALSEPKGPLIRALIGDALTAKHGEVDY